jgi:UDP-glucuronate 4-epimerase
MGKEKTGDSAQPMNVLVTGAAGFIGFHVARKLLENGYRVVGLDNLNPYYEVSLKEDRVKELQAHKNFSFEKIDIADQPEVLKVFENNAFDYVVHLAAQAGVRYSLTHPDIYIKSNIVGTLNILETCRKHPVKHLVFSSSSSVYGANTKLPFSVNQNVDHPVSLYAATKKSDELMAHTYAHLFNIPVTGLRFFTVYGPWGRPDMAIFKFVKAILSGEPIEVFNHGKMKRDFTFIDDVVECVIRTMEIPATPDPNWNGVSPNPSTSRAPYRIYNIGNHSPVMLDDFVHAIEKATGKTAIKKMLPLQPGDVLETFADIESWTQTFGYQPFTPIDEGVHKFVDWYKKYYRI